MQDKSTVDEKTAESVTSDCLHLVNKVEVCFIYQQQRPRQSYNKLQRTTSERLKALLRYDCFAIRMTHNAIARRFDQSKLLL